MNNIEINRVLTKHVKYFEGVYPIDLLPATLLKPSIIVINLDKNYMACSHWVAACFPTLVMPNISIRIVYLLQTRNDDLPATSPNFMEV